MLKTTKSRAEERFTATQKKGKQILKEKEIAEQARSKHVAGLRALRHAKEAADKEAALAAAAQKEVTKPSKKAPRSA
jgi:hypothetical protein